MQPKNAPILWGCFLLWNLYASSSQTDYPGIKARITQRALDYGVEVGVKTMEQMIKDMVIPDLKGSESLDFLKIDYVKYNFSNIKINAFSLPNASLTFVPGVGIRALSNHGTANISTNWDVKAPFLCPIVTNEVEALNLNISALEVLTKIDNYTVLDCSLINPPEITENYLDLNLKGSFYPLESLVDPPFPPVPFELPDRRDSMLYIGISEYFFKSASFAHFVAGALGVMLSTKEISNHFNQNAQGIGSLFSRIAEIYVLSQPFMLQIMATGPPEISLHPNNFSLDLPASIIMLTELENSTIEPIVSMDFVASTSVGLAILGQKLICSLSLNRFRLLLPETSHRDVTVVRFENILSSILHFGVFPLANTKLQQGFPLPNPYNISFVNSDIEVFEGFLLVSTDLKHEATSKQQSNLHNWGSLELVNGPWREQPVP
uniref:Bactericidal permeability-increasing protein n=1 Tax=Nannospalax galili TaxID=1026970 RepID=A0A8C6RE57_NANGA